ncbi:hypothetical protein AOQ84DRAFT_122658 [Glonium stellatum]|uniref:Heterokaryon incompatibility domain-containing protein n=1 Tax=Glonium stellatum TaxID=574774 RepID=A0A8E2F9Q7_9PEZI|nr:hypothetical protein AOQ84DRAFT_122658 [Glonium stellatum]
MPCRLIRIGGSGKEPVLIQTNARPVPYVALSHRWSDSNVLKTTSTSQAQWERSIPYRRLSVVFREVMLFASKLGFQHIWIDSLCIIQDDPEDWRSEASRMSTIYREASLVISVALATDPTQGPHGWSQ